MYQESVVSDLANQIVQNRIWFCTRCGWKNSIEFKFCVQCTEPNPVALPTYPPPVYVPVLVDIPKSRGTYIILGLLVGSLGIHNFYAGRNTVGAVQLILFMLLFWSLIVPFGLICWSVVDVITVKVDGYGKPMR